MDQFRSYTVVDFNPKSHQIKVRFDKFDVTKSIKLLIEEGKYITGESLNNYILTFCPLKVEEDPQIVTNAQEIEKLVSKKYSKRIEKENERNANVALRNQLLTSSDWTQLPDANQNLDDEDRKLWLQYRQALRDITKQPGWPIDVDWPKRPHILGVTIFE